jgi:hypothetical protein
MVDKPKDYKNISSVKYKWSLVDIDDKPIRNGEDDYEFKSLNRITRKHKAIKIGYLKPHQYYKL